jgi:signal transduction histidine kinase
MNIPSSSPALFPSIRKRLQFSPSYISAVDHQTINLSAPVHPDRRQLPRRRAAALAREVRNPLTCIDLSIDMLKSSASAAERKVYLEIIARSSKRINVLIKELLECQEVDSISQTNLSQTHY